MKQHNAATTDNGRKCWNNARERDRMKSRYEIKKRVAAPGETSSSDFVIDDNTKTSDEVISKYLWYIRQGNRSKFSTTFMDCHFNLLRSPHPIRHILEDPVARTHTIQLLASKQSPKDAMRIQQHMESLSRFTLIEYAAWLEKYSIVSAMLYGGINPCIRSCHHNNDKQHQQQQQQQQQPQEQLAEIGSIVLKRFFNSFPLRLSTYIVTSVVHMRRIDDLTAVDNNNSNNNDKIRCLSCQDIIPIDFMLQFNNCHHVFCELCFWKDLLLNIDTPTKHAANDVISCIICGTTSGTTMTNNHSQNNTVLVENNDASSDSSCLSWKEESQDQNLNPSEKYELSLQRFCLLPVNQQALKARSSRKKKHSEIDHISSSWQQAVLPSLGSTQDVRRDKFMIHVERNTIPYVKGCLLGGVDVNQTNEYGQSAIYVAVWRGYSKMVEMLLEHGADPLVPANGGSTMFSVCSILRNTNVIESIDQHHSSSTKTMIESDTGTVLTRYFSKEEQSTASSSNPSFASISNNTNVRCTSLISEFSDHIGAGSCFIDEAISCDTVDVLLQLFHSLPVDTNQKQKKNSAPCSDRSYFCDAEGSIRQLLGNAIVRAGLASTVASVEDITKMSVYNHPSLSSQSTTSSVKPAVRVFPHMRFLNYSIYGTVLPPHIDLVRSNPFGDPLNPKHKSTHTFILYLTDCHFGGATNLLEYVSADGSSGILAKVSPRRGRLLLFPHLCPHEGMEVVDLPKILLRGEVQIDEICTD